MGKKVFTTDYQPDADKKKRGKSFKTKLFDAVRAKSLIGLNPDSTAEEVETAYLSHVAERAFNFDDPASPTLLKETLAKTYPSVKATLPVIKFEFNKDGTASDRVSQILNAASDGYMPPDVAKIFIDAIKASVDIEAVTNLKERIEALEKQLNEAG